MIRRRSGDDRRSKPVPVDQLITKLEGGSGTAAEQLLSLASSSPAIVDRLAASAARGSTPCLELLLNLIAARRLSAPAIARLTSDPSLTEDIEQDVLVAVSRSIGSFRGEAKFTTWLYTLTRNTGIAHLRRVKPISGLADEQLQNEQLPAHRLGHRARPRMSSQVTQREVVRQAIDSLPPQFRQAVFLRDIEGLSYGEIAKRLGLEVNTVRSRLSRGRAMLATRLS